jgi:hypothetical protein
LIIFFHEAAGNLGLRLSYFQKIYEQLDADILCIPYRGYSDSQGTPSEQGLMTDSKAVMEYARSELAADYRDKGGVFVQGRSIGGAVTTYIMTNE